MSFAASAFPRRWIAWTAVAAALGGLLDSIYLTVHHYTNEPVPCNLVSGCEMVLTSPYSQYAGIPLAMYGAAAYFAAFSLALLSLYGYRWTWSIFGLQVLAMAGFTAWLVYVQAVLIGAFCQFCLLSAATTCVLLILFVVSIVLRRRGRPVETNFADQANIIQE